MRHEPAPKSPTQMARERFARIRAVTEALAAPLSADDCQVQSMADASPVKWHLAHTSWFFDTFVLAPRAGYVPFDPAYATLFNSYYNAVGNKHPRPARGLLSRPSIDDVLTYRRWVDAGMERLMAEAPVEGWAALVELGCQHEQQHQELILTDVKHMLAQSPIEGVYAASEGPAPARQPLDWLAHPGGLVDIGHDGSGFAFDSEGPRHPVWLDPFRIASCLVTAGDFIAFIEDGGYRKHALWLSDGWDCVQAHGWDAPLYWRQEGPGWTRFTLGGRVPVTATEPVTHASFYEADAFARWAGRRLPREAEWEVAARLTGMEQLFDAAWQWTSSPYTAYPGFAPGAGAIGEYNGKFMINRMVLRGGSALTPAGHPRRSYRNFFAPEARWQMSGIRLADGG